MFKKIVPLAIAALFVFGSLLGGLCLAQQKKTLRSFRLSKQARAYAGTMKSSSSRSIQRTTRLRKPSLSAKKNTERAKTRPQTLRSLRKSK